MKKMSISLLLLVAALFASQGIMAQEKELFKQTFEFGMEGFKVEGYNGENDDIWFFMFMNHAITCDAYGKITEPLENRLVSPQVTLEKKNLASFVSSAQNFPDVENDIAFSIREVGGAWTDIKLPVTDNEGTSRTQQINIPAAFEGKTVEFGFKYTSKASASSGTWKISQFVVKSGVDSSEPTEKADPQISYDVTEFFYKVGDAFVPPVLSNPNYLTINYSSSNESVAIIDALGNVSIQGEGVTVIKANSIETDKFLAGEASYTLTVSTTGGGGGGSDTGKENVLFEAYFQTGMDGFVVDGNNGKENDVWLWMSGQENMYADGLGKTADGPIENRLTSPEIKLGTENVATFLSNLSWFSGDKSKDVAFSIREVGGAWTDIELPVSNGGMASNITQEIKIPENFDGKTVQIGFKYTAQNSSCAMWYVDNVVVKGKKNGSEPVEKKDPQISFEKETVEYEINSDKLFVAPELVNPNNVTVKYASDNAEVATVDELTGNVTILAEGVAKITATSEETETYKSGKASYTITVTVSTGIEGVTADELENGKIYDLQGRRVNKLNKGIYIVKGKKVVIK